MQHYRKIIHIDMDCFYAAVERLDNINLSGKAIVVGHDSAAVLLLLQVMRRVVMAYILRNPLEWQKDFVLIC